MFGAVLLCCLTAMLQSLTAPSFFVLRATPVHVRKLADKMHCSASSRTPPPPRLQQGSPVASVTVTLHGLGASTRSAAKHLAASHLLELLLSAQRWQQGAGREGIAAGKPRGAAVAHSAPALRAGAGAGRGNRGASLPASAAAPAVAPAGATVVATAATAGVRPEGDTGPGNGGGVSAAAARVGVKRGRSFDGLFAGSADAAQRGGPVHFEARHGELLQHLRSFPRCAVFQNSNRGSKLRPWRLPCDGSRPWRRLELRQGVLIPARAAPPLPKPLPPPLMIGCKTCHGLHLPVALCPVLLIQDPCRGPGSWEDSSGATGLKQGELIRTGRKPLKAQS